MGEKKKNEPNEISVFPIFKEARILFLFYYIISKTIGLK